MEKELTQLKKMSEPGQNQDNDFNSSLFPESIKNFEKRDSDNLIESSPSYIDLSPNKDEQIVEETDEFQLEIQKFVDEQQ